MSNEPQSQPSEEDAAVVEMKEALAELDRLEAEIRQGVANGTLPANWIAPDGSIPL